MKFSNKVLSNVLDILALIVTCTFSVQAQNWTQLGNDIDGEAPYDNSGYSVSLNASGDFVAIGAIYNTGNGTSAGHVRVYELDGSTWIQRGSDIDGEAAGDYSGCSVSLTSIGDIVAIGAYYNSDSFPAAGHVRVYEWDGSTWIQRGSDIDGEASHDRSGYSVDLNSIGDIIVIGAPDNALNGLHAGHVRVYEWDGSTWIKRGSDIDGEAAEDESGNSVSLNSAGDIVAIGAYRNDGNGTDAGHVRVYEWDGSTWIQRGSDIDGEAAGDWSGYCVSLNSIGDIIAIGAPDNDGNGNEAGHVRVYEWDGSTWIQRGSDIDGEAAVDLSGMSVSLNNNGNVVAIGAYLNDGDSTAAAGHVRVYEWDGSTWNQRGFDIDGESKGDLSGHSVDLDSTGDFVAIGAIANDGNGDNAGHVRVYTIEYINTGILDYGPKLFSVYPNPTNSMLNIELSGISDQYIIDITYINGQLILSKEIVGPSHQFDLSSFQKGIYFITIRSNGFVETGKIIVL